jgi:hypothetical protein
MSLRPPLPDYTGLSCGYRKRLGYGDAMEGLPRFSSDRYYRDGYELGRADAGLLEKGQTMDAAKAREQDEAGSIIVFR